jgi:transcriptional regulator with XRE-family HTH domain
MASTMGSCGPGEWRGAASSTVEFRQVEVEAGVSEVKASALAAFAVELRSWRQQLGWSQVELAEKLAYSPSLVSAVETMAKTPTHDFAGRCDQSTGAPGTFARLQALVAREAYPAWFAPVIGFERDAVRLHGWELGVVPGLLQTEAYARALIRAVRPQDSDDAIDRKVVARLERQEILTSEKPPMVWYVLSECVLRQLVGGSAVMAEQLDRLIHLAAQQRIVIQILPFTATDHAGGDGAIALFEFVEAATVAYSECWGGGRIVEAQDEVADVVTVMSMLRASALSREESRELICKIRSEIREQ